MREIGKYGTDAARSQSHTIPLLCVHLASTAQVRGLGIETADMLVHEPLARASSPTSFKASNSRTGKS
jgi:hypothetical protein